MIKLSAIVRELVSLGVTGDALVTAIERIEAASGPVETRSAGAMRQARYRERKRNESVTSDACDVTRYGQKEAPHTPQEKLPPIAETYVSAPPPQPKSPKARFKIPEGWQPSPKTVDAFMALGLTDDDLRWAVSEFVDYWRGSGKAMAEWDRIFLSRAKQQARTHAKRSKPPQNSIADGFAKVRAVIAEVERREAETGRTGGAENLVLLPGLRQGSG